MSWNKNWSSLQCTVNNTSKKNSLSCGESSFCAWINDNNFCMSLIKFYFRKYYSHSHIFWKLLARGFERSCSKLLTTGWTFLQISLLYCRRCFRCFKLVLSCKYNNNLLLRKVNHLQYFSFEILLSPCSTHILCFKFRHHMDNNCLIFKEHNSG